MKYTYMHVKCLLHMHVRAYFSELFHACLLEHAWIAQATICNFYMHVDSTCMQMHV